MLEIFNKEAEQSVIGGLLIQADAFDQVHWLQPVMFYDVAHQYIYSALSDMIQNNKPVDIVTVAEYLESINKLAGVGGLVYLGNLLQTTPGAANIKRYAEIVQEKHINRQLIAVIDEIKLDLMAAGDVYKKLNRAQQKIMAISEKADGNEPVFIADILAERIERIDDAFNGKIKFIETGLLELDRQLGGGIENGSLVIVAASASMGKTALAVQIAESIQDKDGVSLIFTIEMMNGLIVDRLLSAKSKISSTKIRTGQLNEEDFDRLTNSIQPMSALRIMLDDKTTTLNSMRAKARTVKRKHGLNCIVIDYIGLMLSEHDPNQKQDTREQQISSITRGLKGLAKELNIPVIALSQLNRKVADRTNKRPVMSDLRDSGAIEQDADVIMFVYRDEYYDPDTAYKGVAEINIAKNRNGGTGSVIVGFDNEHTVFNNYAGGLPKQETNKKHKRGDYYD
jgi:replicative DNA helicase